MNRSLCPIYIRLLHPASLNTLLYSLTQIFNLPRPSTTAPDRKMRPDSKPTPPPVPQSPYHPSSSPTLPTPPAHP